MNDLYRMQRMIGATPGPLTCFLLERGLKTFGLRMEHHNEAGLAVARMLEAHPKIEKVWYPGLDSHPDREIAKAQMKGFGSVVTFLLRGGDRKTRKFIDSLELFLITPSLGGSESLVTQMWMMSFFDYPEEYRKKIGMVGQPRPPRAGPGGRGRPDRRPEAGIGEGVRPVFRKSILIGSFEDKFPSRRTIGPASQRGLLIFDLLTSSII